MNKYLFCLCLPILLCIGASAQTNLYVDSSVVASGAGTSWGTAFKTINEALTINNGAASSAKYIINVARGIYYPSKLQTGTRRDSSLLIFRAGVKLLGGYPTGGGTRNAGANPTVVSGNINNASTYTDNTYHLLVVAGVTGTDTILVDGLAFENGTANIGSSNFANGQLLQQNFGAGVYNSSVAAPLIFSNCSFSHDTASATGGAMYNTAASPLIINCAFTDNRVGGDGGAISTTIADNLDISNSTFTANRAGRDGGAVFSNRDHVRSGVTRYRSCTFSGNLCGRSAGAVYEHNISGIPATFFNCNFNNNTALYGGAISLANDSSFGGAVSIMSRCNFTGNRALSAGGGMITGYTATVYTMDSCNYTNNVSQGAGGGLYLGDDGKGSVAGQVRHCRFIADSAAEGGGLFNSGTTTYFSDCVFQQNRAQEGGGIFSYSPIRDTFSRCVISGNTAYNTGGGMSIYSSNSRYCLNSCLISGNVAGVRGGGLYDSLSFPTLVNCTLARDTAPSANGIANVNRLLPTALLYSVATVVNCIIWEGDSAHAFFNRPFASGIFASNSIIEGGLSGTGNSSADPLFAAPLPRTVAPSTGGDYHMIPCSPAINTGSNTGSYIGITDLDGNPRLYGTNVDPGAYEYPYTYPTAITGDTGVCAGEVVQLGNATAGGTWSSSNTAVANVSSTGIVTSGTTGSAIITYTIGGPCPAVVTRSFTVSHVDPTVTVSGATLTAIQGGALYQWLDCTSGNAPLPGQTNQTFTPAANGQYAVAVSLAGCADTSACIAVSNVGLPGIGAMSPIQLWPNPARQSLRVSTGRTVATRIVLSDMTGRQLLTVSPREPMCTLDLRPFAPGIYCVEVWQNGARHTDCVQIAR